MGGSWRATDEKATPKATPPHPTTTSSRHATADRLSPRYLSHGFYVRNEMLTTHVRGGKEWGEGGKGVWEKSGAKGFHTLEGNARLTWNLTTFCENKEEELGEHLVFP